MQTDSRQIVEIAKILQAAENKLAKLFGPLVCVKLDVAIVTERQLSVSEKRLITKHIIERVAEYYQLDVKLMTTETRVRNVIEARSICYLLMKHFCGTRFTLKEIARSFNQQDHTTIINGLRNAENYYSLYDFYKEKVDDLIQIINNNKN